VEKLVTDAVCNIEGFDHTSVQRQALLHDTAALFRRMTSGGSSTLETLSALLRADADAKYVQRLKAPPAVDARVRASMRGSAA
jgi:hypothetical protein